MSLLTDLDAGLIPHARWATREWWCADPRWYYHRPRQPGRPVPSGRFYDHVDPDLRPLCRLLHAAGLTTTPSCQGHFYPRHHFDAVWDTLVHQAARIRGHGLPVTDPETGRTALFRNRQHRLPWPTREQFIAQAMAHQVTGYLGILAPEETQWLGELERIEGVELHREEGVLALVVKTANDTDQRRAWMQVLRQSRAILSDGYFSPQKLPAFPL